MTIRHIVRNAYKGMLALLVGLTGCAAPLAPVQAPAGAGAPLATMTLSTSDLVERLATKAATNWQDAAMTYPPLLARRQALAGSKRALQAVAAPGWSYALTGGDTSTNVPAYLKANVYAAGPNPQAGDRLFVLTNNGKLLRFNPTSASAPAQAAPAVGAGLPGTYAKTAIAVSGDNRRVYAFSAAGHFTIVDADTLAQTYAKDISSSGFSGTAFYVDYGLNTSGGDTTFGSSETLFAVSSNGSVFRILVDGGTTPPTVTVNAAPAPGETNPGGGAWATSTPLAIPASTVVGFPVAWRGQVFYGTNAGMFYQVDFSNAAAPALAASWDLGQRTTATGLARAITAPAALDYDAAFDVDKVFVPCGDRVCWIDLATNAVTASPSLTLDRSKAISTPVAAAAPPNQGLLSSFAPASTGANAFVPDWISIKKGQLPPPTRWGGPLDTLAQVPALSVRTRPNGDVWVCDYGKPSAPVRQPNVTIYHANGTPAKVINLSGPPTKLEFDGQGFAWLSVSGYSAGGAQGKVEKINCATEALVGGAFPVTFRGAVYIAPDANGNCWVTDPFNRPGTGSPDATAGGGTAGRLQCIKPNGAFAFANPVAVPVAGTIFCAPDNRPWVIPYGGNVVQVFNPAPAAANGPAPAAPTTITVGAGGSLPIGIAFRPGFPEAWITLNQQSKIAKVNYNTLAAMGGLIPASGAFPNNPWTIRFDANGEPWVGCGRLNQTTPQNVVKLDLNGNTVPGFDYSMAAYGGSPYEIAFDAGDAVYVANANPTFSAGSLAVITQDIGNTGDIFGSGFRSAPGDGDDSFGFMRFKWAAGTFANQPIVDARLTLTQNAAAAGDTLAFSVADSARPDGTPWLGYAGTPNTDWSSRPKVGFGFASIANGAPGTGLTRTVLVPSPADKANVAGDPNANLTLAVQSTNRPLRQAVHWFSDNTNATAAQLPTLTVRRNTYAAIGTGAGAGINCQPTLDSDAKKLWVAASNALFELDYANPGAFAMPDRVYYNFTQNGGAAGNGPINTTSRTYLNATGNALYTLAGRVVIPDLTPAGTLNLNTFNVNLAGTSNRLIGGADLAPGTGGVNAQMLYDYEGGSAYVVTTNNYVIRAKVL